MLLREIVHIALKLFLIQTASSRITSFKDGEITYEYDDESNPLGSGALGKVFKGIRKNGNMIETVAFKESQEINLGLMHEKDVYERIGPHDSIPKLYYYVSAPNKNDILVTELLGENLRSLFKKYNQFSSVTIMRIGLQLLDVLEHMHQRGVAHRDAHHSNLAVGYKNDSKIYVFDFDQSMMFPPGVCVVDGHDLRRIDLIILARMLQEFAEGFNKSNKTVSKEALDEFYEKVSDFEPNYDELRKILKTELEKYRYEPNYDKFDWQIFHTDNSNSNEQ